MITIRQAETALRRAKAGRHCSKTIRRIAQLTAVAAFSTAVASAIVNKDVISKETAVSAIVVLAALGVSSVSGKCRDKYEQKVSKAYQDWAIAMQKSKESE